MRLNLFERFIELPLTDRLIIGVSMIVAGFIIVDPLTHHAVSLIDEDARNFFRAITDLGKSGWILIPSGLAGMCFFVLWQGGHRRRLNAAYGVLMAGSCFIFLCVAGSGIVANLVKNTLGRARPKLFDSLGPLSFEPLSFTHDFASFPSGHATTIFAFGAAIAFLWPRARIAAYVAAGWIAATRYFVGAHYVTDTIAGGVLGVGFTMAVRHWFLSNRWLFAMAKGGKITLRGRAVRRWLARQIWNIRPHHGAFGRPAGFSGHS